MKKVRFIRFIVHLFKCLAKGKESHSSIVEWLPIIALVLLFFSAIAGPTILSGHELGAWLEEKRWSICGFGAVIWIILAFWHSFTRYDDAEQQLASIHNDRIKLSVKFLVGEKSPVLGLTVFQVEVTNQHHSKSAQSVRVSLKSLIIGGKSKNPTSPITLPVRPDQYLEGQKNSSECQINPGASRYFDLACACMDENLEYYLGIPPFAKNNTGIWKPELKYKIGDLIIDHKDIHFAVTVSGSTIPLWSHSGDLRLTTTPMNDIIGGWSSQSSTDSNSSIGTTSS